MDTILGLVRHGGNAALFAAAEMSILSTLSGQPFHLHAEGLRGTGKTTILRSARRLAPPIERIKDCPYNCDPAQPHCPLHRHLDQAAISQLGSEWIPMPFLEISHSARIGTVVGSIDLSRLVDPKEPQAALLPGSLPQAHRGVLLVDEINRLAETAPELADVLLDVMGTKPGRVQIEESGLPTVELPLMVSVWAASNPDEDPGPLEEVRRQLSDRFDLVVPMGRPTEAEVVALILAQEPRPWHLPSGSAELELIDGYRKGLGDRAALLSRVVVPQPIRSQLADLYARHGLESLRAVQAILVGMRLRAALAGRSEVLADDLVALVPLALHHRLAAEALAKLQKELAGQEAPKVVAAAATRQQQERPLAAGEHRPAPAQPPAQGSLTRPAAEPSPQPQTPPQGRAGLLQRFFGRRGSPQQGGGGSGAPSSTAAQPQLLDPTKVEPVAPSELARPLSSLDPADFVKTQRELEGP